MDILRGMAILMVLLYHSVIVFPLNLHEIPWCERLHTFLWVVQMPLFFLVSGVCYSYKGSYREYARKKCMRILVPHIVFSLLDILPRIIPNPLVNEQMDPEEALLDFLLYGGSDWFLWTLFVIVMLFPLLERLLLKDGKSQMAGGMICLLLFVIKPFVTDFFLFNMVSSYLIYFFLGYEIRKKGEILLKKAGQGKMLLPALCGMLLSFAWFLAWRDLREDASRYAELVCVLCSFVFFYGLSLKCQGTAERFLRLCGRWSLPMYLLDAYALVATRTVLVSILGISSPAVIILGNFFLDTGIVLAVSCFILAKGKVFRFLCGISEKG